MLKEDLAIRVTRVSPDLGAQLVFPAETDPLVSQVSKVNKVFQAHRVLAVHKGPRETKVKA